MRAQFWTELGIKPAKNSSDIDIAPAARLKLLSQLGGLTIGGKEQDGELRHITQQALAEIADIAIGSFSYSGPSMALDMNLMAPASLRSFFLTAEMTSYEEAKFGADG